MNIYLVPLGVGGRLWLPLGRLWVPFRSIGMPFWLIWDALGLIWGPLGHIGVPWGRLGEPLGALGRLLGCLLGPLGPPWGALGCLGAPFGDPWDAYINKKLIFSNPPRLPTKSSLREHAAGVTGVTEAAEMVSRTVARTPPSTHAGGQDDGSYTNSLKLYIYIYIYSKYSTSHF